MKNSQFRSRLPRKTSDRVLVELRRGAASRLVRVRAGMDIADADRLSLAINQLLLAGGGPRIELRMIQVEEVTPAAWVEILACSIQCQKRGVELATLGMRAKVRRQLGSVWDWAATEAERVYRWSERVMTATRLHPETRGA